MSEVLQSDFSNVKEGTVLIHKETGNKGEIKEFTEVLGSEAIELLPYKDVAGDVVITKRMAHQFRVYRK